MAPRVVPTGTRLQANRVPEGLLPITSDHLPRNRATASSVSGEHPNDPSDLNLDDAASRVNFPICASFGAAQESLTLRRRSSVLSDDLHSNGPVAGLERTPSVLERRPSVLERRPSLLTRRPSMLSRRPSVLGRKRAEDSIDGLRMRELQQTRKMEGEGVSLKELVRYARQGDKEKKGEFAALEERPNGPSPFGPTGALERRGSVVSLSTSQHGSGVGHTSESGSVRGAPRRLSRSLGGSSFSSKWSARQEVLGAPQDLRGAERPASQGPDGSSEAREHAARARGFSYQRRPEARTAAWRWEDTEAGVLPPRGTEAGEGSDGAEAAGPGAPPPPSPLASSARGTAARSPALRGANALRSPALDHSSPYQPSPARRAALACWRAPTARARSESPAGARRVRVSPEDSRGSLAASASGAGAGVVAGEAPFASDASQRGSSAPARDPDAKQPGPVDGAAGTQRARSAAERAAELQAKIVAHRRWMLAREAERGNAMQCVELLQAGAEAWWPDAAGRTPCHLAALADQGLAVAALCDSSQDGYHPYDFSRVAADGAGPLHYAAFVGALQAGRMLLKQHRAQIQRARDARRAADEATLAANGAARAVLEAALGPAGVGGRVAALRAEVPGLEARVAGAEAEQRDAAAQHAARAEEIKRRVERGEAECRWRPPPARPGRDAAPAPCSPCHGFRNRANCAPVLSSGWFWGAQAGVGVGTEAGGASCALAAAEQVQAPLLRRGAGEAAHAGGGGAREAGAGAG